MRTSTKYKKSVVKIFKIVIHDEGCILISHRSRKSHLLQKNWKRNFLNATFQHDQITRAPLHRSRCFIPYKFQGKITAAFSERWKIFKKSCFGAIYLRRFLPSVEQRLLKEIYTSLDRICLLYRVII